MKRRGFIGLLIGFFLLALKGLAAAICNPYLARLFERGRSRVQIRGGSRDPANRYFVQWLGASVVPVSE